MHDAAVAEPGRVGQLFGGVGVFFEHHLSDFHAERFDRLGGRLARLPPERARKLSHAEVRGFGEFLLAKMIPTLTALTYEPGMAVADGDIVMVHGRYTGRGPKPLVAVDIFRVSDGQSGGTLGRDAGGSRGG